MIELYVGAREHSQPKIVMYTGLDLELGATIGISMRFVIACIVIATAGTSSTSAASDEIAVRLSLDKRQYTVG